MKVTGTLVWYYHVCRREVWLMSRQINAFQEDDFLEIGRLIHDESYRREKKEIRFENAKIDLIKNSEGTFTVVEVKKSSKSLKAAQMQLLFYLWKLERNGIRARGELRIPREKKRLSVDLNDDLRGELEKVHRDIQAIAEGETPPLPVKIGFCRRCAYGEFCWS